MKIKVKNQEQFLREMFFLVWEACDKPFSMGVYQARPSATKDEVLRNVVGAGDYPINMDALRENGIIYGDYVFGKMMKWGCKLTDDGWIDFNTGYSGFDKFNPEYQSFCNTYKNTAEIIGATLKSLNISPESIRKEDKDVLRPKPRGEAN